MFLYKITQQNLNKYKEKSVFFSKPKLVDYYDYNYGTIEKAKRINYFRNLKSDMYPIDLNDGFETYVCRQSIMYQRYIELSLRYEMSIDAERDGVENMEKTKVITRRGTLVHIMELYYNKRHYDDLFIRVSRYNGNIYMIMEEQDQSLEELKMPSTHHGHLHRLLFTDSPNKPPDINKPYDNNIQLVGIHRSNFGKYDIIYSGEIQGIISDEKINDFDDREALNGCRFVFSKQMWARLKHKDNKYLTYWLQAYLANVKDIYFGYKYEDGIIEEPIERKSVADIPKNRFWQPVICTGFLYDFLQHVEKCMSSVNCLETVYVFCYNQKEKSFSYDILKGKNEKTFITKEYMRYCEEKKRL